MRQQPRMLLATADPLLNQRLAGMAGAAPIEMECETAEQCLERATAVQPEWVILSRAAAPWPGGVAALVAELGRRLPRTERVVLADTAHFSADELEAIRRAGGRVAACPEAAVSSLKALLRAPVSTSIPQAGMGSDPPERDTVRLQQVAGPTVILQDSFQHTVLIPSGPNPRETGGGAPFAPGQPTQQIPQPFAEQPGARGGAQPMGWHPSRQSVGLPAGGAPAVQFQATPPLPSSDGKAVLRQRVVTFWGGKPGTGRSTLLVAVADLIARMPGVRVCAVDLNPVNSSLAPLLRKETEPNSWWRLGEALLEGSLTPQAVRESLITVRPGWSLLSGPGGSDQWCALLTARVVADLVALLRADFDYILLDLSAGRGPVADAAITHAQQVLLTVSGFFPDVVDTARQYQQLVADGLAERERCSLVLSPWVDSAELPAADVGACMGLPVAATVPLAALPAMAAARTGRPITQLGTSEAQAYTGAAAAVAALITGRNVVRPQRRSWFGH